MIKIPKLSDLTNMEKLKELGNAIVDNAKEQVDRVKNTVNENAHVGQLCDKVKSAIGSADKTEPIVAKTELHEQVAAIEASLQALFEAQKHQLHLMNALKKRVNHLLAIAKPPASDADIPHESNKIDEERQ